MIDFASQIATELELNADQVSKTVKLLEDGNTVPFITRYRKEQTGGLDETKIREVKEKHEYYTSLHERKEYVLSQIEEQDKLTDELKKKIEEADSLKVVEDLYLPYKPKKRTKATVAREKGLEPLAEEVWKQEISDGDFKAKIKDFIDPEKEVESEEDVLEGVQHILAEWINETAEIRDQLRTMFRGQGKIESKATDEEAEKGDNSDYRDYFEFSQKVDDIPPHRVLALNRGEKEGALRVYVRVPEEAIQTHIAKQLITTEEEEVRKVIKEAIADGYNRLLFPSLAREVRSDLTEMAEDHAIHVFAENLRKVLLQPPVRGKRILGIDPGFKSGCKLAAVDEFGKLLEVDAIYPHPPQKKREEAEAKLLDQIKKHEIDIVAIGNGTAHRETEELVSEVIAKNQLKTKYIIVNEAGASVYSASKEAQDEFPDLDASYRGTISIARRLQDPLAEIVKIDPKSMGVGLYQHDVNPKELDTAVEVVVESCVNFVGVDLNTASTSLLKHISGLNRLQAKRIYDWRQDKGEFKSRKGLMSVKGIGDETFTQAAGFLRIPEGENPLDNTQIHPESYDKTQALLDKVGGKAEYINNPHLRKNLHQSLRGIDLPALSEELGVGLPTLKDIVDNLKKPGRDPRDKFSRPHFRKGVLKLEDLRENMQLKGTVRNVVDFGAFVDIGVKEDGLVHISELADKYVKNPHEIVSVGDVVDVRIIDVDTNRRRISLSMRPPESERSEKKGKGKGKKSKGKSRGSSKKSSQKSSSPSQGRLGALLQKELNKNKN